MKARVAEAVCNACEVRVHGGDWSVKRCVDFGRYERVTGLPRPVRFLCEEHARGLKAHALLVPVPAEEQARRKALSAAYARYRGGRATADDMQLIELDEKALR